MSYSALCNWRKTLKAGDKVHFGATAGGTRRKVLEILRFTSTQAICGLNGTEYGRFMLAYGTIIGGCHSVVRPADPAHPLFGGYGYLPVWDPNEKYSPARKPRVKKRVLNVLDMSDGELGVAMTRAGINDITLRDLAAGRAILHACMERAT